MSNWDLIQKAITESIKLESTTDSRIIWFDKERKNWKCCVDNRVEKVEFSDWYDGEMDCKIFIYEEKDDLSSSVIKSLQSPCINKICMVRTYSAGVFYGKLVSKNGKEGILENARRVYYWEGAATLSQLANSGTSLPEKCKFPEEVPLVELTEIIEIIPVSIEALKTLNKVKVWKQ